MTVTTVVFGYGAVGRPLVQALAARGDIVRVATRNRPSDLPAGVEHVPCDVLDLEVVRETLKGASQAVLAVGFPYDARVWRAAWPKTMSNIVEGCASVGARLVFIDNLYQLGPQNRPRTEETPLATSGEKPMILAEVTRIWQQASDRVKVAALRCSDFYGPGVTNSHLGATAFGEMAKGKPAQLMVPPDTAHDFAYVPDIVRAAVLLLDAPDTDYGQVWNMPCAPTQTPRSLLQLGAETLGRKLQLLVVPFALLKPMGWVFRFAKEVVDVGFTWDRPYVVDGDKFAHRFGFVPTPFAVGVPATIHACPGSR